MKQTAKKSFFPDFRFNVADFTLLLLAMAGLLALTWWAFVKLPAEKPQTREIRVRFCVSDLPDEASGKISRGDMLYTERGNRLGEVETVSYIPKSGSGITAYLDVTLTVRDLYNGYGVQCGDEMLTLAVGGQYALHTPKAGAKDAVFIGVLQTNL